MRKIIILAISILALVFAGCADNDSDDNTVVTYTVAFMIDGQQVSTVQVESGSVVAAPKPAPSKKGYNFLGWYLGDSAYDFSKAVTSNLTLTAKFEVISPEDAGDETVTEKFTVTFMSDGEQFSTAQVESGTVVAAPETAPSKKGYNFLGWYLGDSAYDFSKAVTANLTLTAKFEVIEVLKYTVTFENDGTTFTTQQIELNGTATEPESSPLKEGYTFKGWYLGDSAYDFSKPVTANLTLTAKFEIIKYTVTFDVDGVTSTVQVEYGSTAEEPATPSKDGYNFLGWYLDDSIYDFSKAVTANLTLTAKFELIPVVKYTVTFKNGDEVYSTVEVESGKTVSAPETSPSKEKYSFLGWYLGESEYNFSTAVTSDITLTAVFQKQVSEIETNITAYIDWLCESVDGNDWYRNWSKYGEGFKGKWNYIEGVLLNSLLELYKSDTENNAKYLTSVQDYVKHYIGDDGTFYKCTTKKEKSGSGGFATGELDSICESRILFDLVKYDSSYASAYDTAIGTTYDSLLAMTRCYDTTGSQKGLTQVNSVNANNFNHKDSSAKYQIWLDGFYMYGPFYARCASYTDYASGSSGIYNALYQQFKFAHEHMWDSTKKLHYHGIDTTIFKDSSSAASWASTDSSVRPLGCSESFWLRSNGWYIVALTDVLEYFPEGTEKEELKSILAASLEGIMTHQDSSSKLFYNVVDGYDSNGPLSYDISSSLESWAESNRGTNKKVYWQTGKTLTGSSGSYKIQNYLETSGSAMVAYSCMKAARLGYVNSAYADKGKAIFESLYNTKFTADTSSNTYELKDIIIQSGLSNGFSEPAYYIVESMGSNEPKGIGPFIMAYIEYVK